MRHAWKLLWVTLLVYGCGADAAFAGPATAQPNYTQTLVGLEDLQSTLNGKGASLVAIEDAANNFTATTVEGALAETLSDLASTAGAGSVGILDTAGNFSATTVEGALAETLTDLASAAGGASLVANARIVFDPIKYGATVGDTADDATAIQLAVDACVAAKGKLLFRDGTYLIGQQIEITGPCTLEWDATAEVVAASGFTGNGMFFVTSSDVHFINPRLDVTNAEVMASAYGGRSSVDTVIEKGVGIFVNGTYASRLSNITITGGYIHDAPFGSVFIYSADNVHIDRLRTKNGGAEAYRAKTPPGDIRFSYSDNSSVTRCEIIDAGMKSVAAGQCNNMRMEGNHAAVVDSTPADVQVGFFLNDGYNWRCIGNSTHNLYGAKYDGGRGSGNYGFDISDNTFISIRSGSATGGIRVEGGFHGIVANNTIIGDGRGNGITVNGDPEEGEGSAFVTIEGNNIWRFAPLLPVGETPDNYHGIAMFSGDSAAGTAYGPVTDITLRGNTIYGATYGIFTQVGSSTTSGIAGHYARIKVLDNEIYHATSDGIYLYGQDNEATGNTVYSFITKTFTDAEVDATNDTVEVSLHHLSQAHPFTLTTSGTLPAPLAVSTRYYTVPTRYVAATTPAAQNTIRIAMTPENAIAGTYINLTDAGSGTHTMVFDRTQFGIIFIGLSGASATGPLVAKNNKIYGVENHGVYAHANAAATKLEIVGNQINAEDSGILSNGANIASTLIAQNTITGTTGGGNYGINFVGKAGTAHKVAIHETETTSVFFDPGTSTFTGTFRDNILGAQPTTIPAGIVCTDSGSGVPTITRPLGSVYQRTGVVAGGPNLYVRQLTGGATDSFVDGNVDTGTEVLTVTGHGIADDTLVQLTTDGTLPAGLALATSYYVKSVTVDTLTLHSATPAAVGNIVDITAAAGGGTHTITSYGNAWVAH